MLQSMGSQRVGYSEQLNGTDIHNRLIINYT